MKRLIEVLNIIATIIICFPIIFVTLFSIGIVILIDIPVYLITGKHIIEVNVNNKEVNIIKKEIEE